MRIILLQDIRGVGKKNDVKDVADGYARNFLVAAGKARAATAGVLREIEAKRSAGIMHRAAEDKEIVAAFNALKNTRIVVSEKANDKGRLFAALDAKKIAHIVHYKTGAHIPEEAFGSIAIKETGEHNIRVVRGEHNTTFVLIVEKA